MKLYSENKEYKLYQGNMLDMLDVIEPNSIDAIVTDPPYELGFMNKSWDSTGIAFQKETWEKCLKVLKPGGYLLSFAGSRTQHRIACAIEDAGFEIRDTIMWLYGCLSNDTEILTSNGWRNSNTIKNGDYIYSLDLDIDCSEYAPQFYRVLKDGSHCYVMTNHLNLINMLNTFTSCGFHFIKSLIWDKQNKIMGQFYMSQFEYILFFRKGKGLPINNCGTSDILSIPNKKCKDENGQNYHDTEKPVELMKILVENSSNEGGIVLDPFMGIGATGVACKELNRSFIGIEIDNKYFEIAKNRIYNAQYQKIDEDMPIIKRYSFL